MINQGLSIIYGLIRRRGKREKRRRTNVGKEGADGGRRIEGEKEEE